MVSVGPAARQMTITISGLPPAWRGHFYEAWLLQPASGKMLPVGVLLTPGSPVSYRLPATLTLGYSYVESAGRPMTAIPRTQPTQCCVPSSGHDPTALMHDRGGALPLPHHRICGPHPAVRQAVGLRRCQVWVRGSRPRRFL